MLTKGNFTRDQWSHLLRLFNIMNFSIFSCNLFLPIQKPNTMSKRAQERRTREQPVLAKSRPVSLISRSLSAYQSPTLDSGTSYSPEKCRLGWNSDLTSTEKSGRATKENDNESSDTPWRKLQGQPVLLQEHRLRGAQDIVRHHAEADLEPEARDQEHFHD